MEDAKYEEAKRMREHITELEKFIEALSKERVWQSKDGIIRACWGFSYEQGTYNYESVNVPESIFHDAISYMYEKAKEEINLYEQMFQNL